MVLNQHALADIAFDAAGDGVTAPATLRRRVLDAARRGTRTAMHTGWTTRAPSASHPPARNAFDAYLRTAAELGDLLGDLASDEWRRPTATPAGSVRGVVVHLVGVERYALGQLGRRAPLHAPAREDHFPVSRSATGDTAGLTDDEIARVWWLEVLEVVRACGALGPGGHLVFHHLPLSVRGFLVLRTFELWTHGEDIRRATGRDRNLLDADRLSLMSRGLVDVLPVGMAISGVERPGATVRLVLTGPGGARYDTALAPGGTAGEPDAAVTMSTLDLCRVAARQLPADRIEMTVEGDGELVDAMLVGAQAFAAD